MKKFVFSLGALMFILFFVIVATYLQKNNPGEIAKNNHIGKTANRVDYSSFEEEDLKLGDNSFAVWEYSGYSTVAADGTSRLGSILIHGRDNEDVTIRVKLHAVIGHLTFPFPDFTVNVAKGTDVSRQIDLRPFFNLHPKQLEYTLKIYGYAQLVEEGDGKTKFGMRFDTRFLAFNESENFFELMDFETREELYPYGFTTPEGQQMVQQLLLHARENNEHLEAIGPSMYN